MLGNYDKGTYHLSGNLIANLSEKKAAKLRNEMVGFVFQSFNLISFKNLNNAETQMNRAKLSADDAKIDYDRQQKLYDSWVISYEKYKRAKVSYDAARDELSAAENNLDLIQNGVTKGPRPPLIPWFGQPSTGWYWMCPLTPQVFEKRMVETGISDGINIEVTKGLAIKDKVKGEKIDPKKAKEEEKKKA